MENDTWLDNDDVSELCLTTKKQTLHEQNKDKAM